VLASPSAQLRSRRADRAPRPRPGAGRTETTRRVSIAPPTAWSQAAPASQALLIRAAERGANLGAITAGLMRLLDRYGAAEMQAAILEALQRDVPHPNAVRLALGAAARAARRGTAGRHRLPAHVQARDTPVRPHALETYDQLKEKHDADED
jgi:hypothetical protein